MSFAEKTLGSKKTKEIVSPTNTYSLLDLLNEMHMDWKATGIRRSSKISH